MNNLKILIIEPNSQLHSPYYFFPPHWSTQRSGTIEIAFRDLQRHSPDIIFLSTSFSLTKIVRLLDTVKNLSFIKLIPVVFVVDLSQRVSHFPGTTWGGKIGIIHTLSSKAEINSMLTRVLNS